MSRSETCDRCNQPWTAEAKYNVKTNSWIAKDAVELFFWACVKHPINSTVVMAGGVAVLFLFVGLARGFLFGGSIPATASLPERFGHGVSASFVRPIAQQTITSLDAVQASFSGSGVQGGGLSNQQLANLNAQGANGQQPAQQANYNGPDFFNRQQ